MVGNNRTLQFVFDNVTTENIYSEIPVFYTLAGPFPLYFSNYVSNNVSLGPISAFHGWFRGNLGSTILGDMTFKNIRISNCNSKARVFIILSSYKNATIENWVFVNNTCKLNFLNILDDPS
jgi:hypothetical protein